MLSAVRVDRVGHETADRRGGAAIQAIREHRVDQCAFEHAMQRAERH